MGITWLSVGMLLIYYPLDVAFYLNEFGKWPRWCE